MQAIGDTMHKLWTLRELLLDTLAYPCGHRLAASTNMRSTDHATTFLLIAVPGQPINADGGRLP